VKTVRLATVRATGRRYVVAYMDFNADPAVAVCYGDVVRGRGLRWTHGETIRFPVADVDVAEVPRTDALFLELFEQSVAVREANGSDVRRTRGGNAVDYGTPRQRAVALIVGGRNPWPETIRRFAEARGMRGVPERLTGDELSARLFELAVEAERKGLNDQAGVILEWAAGNFNAK
jgi:hypothetical protein